MDRLEKLRRLVDQALEDLSGPTALTHEQYAIVAVLHQISIEIDALRYERLRISLGEERP